MDKKQLLINAAIIIFVPTIITAGYYGYKAYRHYKNKKKEGEEENKLEEGSPKTEEENTEKEGKIIPISKQIEEKEKLTNTGS